MRKDMQRLSDDRPMIESLVDELRLMPGVKRSVIAYRAWRTEVIERWLRINTRSAYSPDSGPRTRLGDGHGYVPVDYGALWHYMRPVRLLSSDVAFDIGCGMGRVLCMFSRLPIKKCIGVEYNEGLANIARRNAVTLRARRAPIEVRVGDAADADYSEGTVFWLWNPFGERTLQCVMDRIEQSIRISPRPVQIVYIRPQHEDVLHACSWLCCTGKQNALLHAYGHASYWTNVRPKG